MNFYWKKIYCLFCTAAAPLGSFDGFKKAATAAAAAAIPLPSHPTAIQPVRRQLSAVQRCACFLLLLSF
jgi:hypothetical protein